MLWIRGSALPFAMQQEALRRYVHRWTQENQGFWRTRDKPRIPCPTDAEWLDEYAFAVKRGGSFDNRVRHCVPASIYSRLKAKSS